MLLSQSYQYPNLSEGADRVGHGQLRGDKECPFSGVTKSGRVWRKVPKGDARSQTPSTGLRHPSFNHCRIYYAIGSSKLSANEQFLFCFLVFFYVGAQTVVRVLQTTQIKPGVSFIAANKVYTSTNKTTIV